MDNKATEREVIIAKDGTPYSVMARPGGLGTFADYHHKVQEYRKQYAHIFDKQPIAEYLEERKKEALREYGE